MFKIQLDSTQTAFNIYCVSGHTISAGSKGNQSKPVPGFRLEEVSEANSYRWVQITVIIKQDLNISKV